MRLTLTIDCDNGAFVPHLGDEVARLLFALGTHLQGAEAAEAPLENTLRDTNGNTVGAWKLAD